ncbi:MAG: hypothetical protein HOA22_11085, partial [Gammaproteobacteria bacterium]|nr:hypothetical protein [Gammaproteobacteria bacterium]
NSDAASYGGSNCGNSGTVQSHPTPFHGQRCSLSLTIPPLGCLILQFDS